MTGWHEPSDSLASIVSPNRFLLEPPLHDGTHYERISDMIRLS